MGFSNDERETILRYDFLTKRWYAWTNVESHINKFTKQNWQQTKGEYEGDRLIAAEFEAGKTFVTIGNTKRKKADHVGNGRIDNGN